MQQDRFNPGSCTQCNITIRLVLPEGVAAPDLDGVGPASVCGLLGALVYTVWPDVAQEVQIDVGVEPLEVSRECPEWSDVAMPVRD